MHNESGPRQTAAKYVYKNYIFESPRFKVSPAYVDIKYNAVACGAQTVTQLDVFDRGARELLDVEATDLEEGVLADRAAAGPEG